MHESFVKIYNKCKVFAFKRAYICVYVEYAETPRNYIAKPKMCILLSNEMFTHQIFGISSLSVL